MHNEAKPIFYFGYLGGKEGAIQWACGREILMHACSRGYSHAARVVTLARYNTCIIY